MKKILLSIIIIIAIVFVVLSISKSQGSVEKTYYTLKPYNDSAAIFKNDSNAPIELLNINLNNIPYLEREEIENGIVSDNLEYLMKLAEDYEG